MNSEPEVWIDLIPINSLEKNDVTPIEYNNTLLAVYDSAEGIFVSSALCSHAGANLCDGYFDGKNIECPLHQGLFDARTGQAIAAPATRSLRMYPSRVNDGTVQIRFESTLNNQPRESRVVSSLRKTMDKLKQIIK